MRPTGSFIAASSIPAWDATISSAQASLFEEIIRAVEVATVGQIARTLWEVRGRFRPSM